MMLALNERGWIEEFAFSFLRRMVTEEGGTKTGFLGVIPSNDLGKGWGNSRILATNMLFEYFSSLGDIGCLFFRGVSCAP